MMIGRVTAEREAIVTIEILGPEDQTAVVEAGLDTGYNGFLTLPGDLIDELNLPYAGTAGAELGDGNKVRMDLYLGTVRWDDGMREVLVLEASGGALVGMAMLYGSRVTLEVEENGSVRIEPLIPIV
jgi:predicted aspartyl protease